MRWIGVVNLALAGMILFVAALFNFLIREKEYPHFISRTEQKELPRSLFGESDEFFQEIGEGLLALTWVPPQMQLPDLRQELFFYGKNARPDSLAGKSTFHFSLKGSEERALIPENERIYLVYQGNYSPRERKDLFREPLTIAPRPLWGEVSQTAELDKAPYVFSPGNQPTPLWFEAKSINEHSIEVRVSMLDEKGALVFAPANLSVFPLQLQDFQKTQVHGWDLNGCRVDTTLLVRQKARWIGTDLFLELHGGDDLAYARGKERIDFLDGVPYSCFISVGDYL